MKRVHRFFLGLVIVQPLLGQALEQYRERIMDLRSPRPDRDSEGGVIALVSILVFRHHSNQPESELLPHLPDK